MTIEYRVTLSDGTTWIETVDAHTIDTGFTAALRSARATLGRINRERGSKDANLHSLAFWQVKT